MIIILVYFSSIIFFSPQKSNIVVTASCSCRRMQYWDKEPWRCFVVVITTVQLHSVKPEFRFCAGSNPVNGMLEICNGEDLWQWFWLFSLNAFRRPSIYNKSRSLSLSHFGRYFYTNQTAVTLNISDKNSIAYTFLSIISTNFYI